MVGDVTSASPRSPFHISGLDSKKPNSIIIKHPLELDNPAVEIIICQHLLCIFVMLGVCASSKASPLVRNTVQMDLLTELAKDFPAVTQALNVKETSSLIPKQNALALKILEDILPSAGNADSSPSLFEPTARWQAFMLLSCR
jgi:hypothetical protein